MSRGYWYSLIAVVGWLAFGSLSYAQQQTGPTLESQPVTPSQQEITNAGNQKGAPEKQPQAESLTPALNKIESAIRDVVPQKDEANDHRQEERDKADLQAQEDMAFWAKGMFWATCVTVIVTLVGLALIGRTLHHTKRAANYASDMVDEAKAATKAARDAVDVTRQIGQAQVRAYVSCSGGTYKLSPENFECMPMLVNSGQSPATQIKMSARLVMTVLEPKLDTLASDTDSGICGAIPARGQTAGLIMWGRRNLGLNLFELLQHKGLSFEIICRVSWTDVFGDPQAAKFSLSPIIDFALIKRPTDPERSGEMTVFNNRPD